MEEQCLSELKDELVSLQVIRDTLIKLELNPTPKYFFDYNVNPLVLSLYYLSMASFHFSSSASLLNNMNMSKNSEIKDIIRLVYDIKDISEDVTCELDKQIKKLIKTYNK